MYVVYILTVYSASNSFISEVRANTLLLLLLLLLLVLVLPNRHPDPHGCDCIRKMCSHRRLKIEGVWVGGTSRGTLVKSDIRRARG